MLAMDEQARVKLISELGPYTLEHESEIQAHIDEALRELPAMKAIYHEIRAVCNVVALVVKLIKWVREEYFSDFETKENEEKGEETMAMKKAPAKAAAKKAPAKKAAAKAPVKKAAAKKCAK